MEFRIKEARRAEAEFEVRQEWIPLEEISPNLQRAVLAAEDDRFYQHSGIDWLALAEEVHYQGDTLFSWWSGDDRRALWEALAYLRAHRNEIKGRSTLTQQLAKNLYFTPGRSFLRKLNEAVVAKRLEFFLPKERILELYLNVAEWGPGIFGAEAAARAYFNVGAGNLTLVQAAALAATLPHPLTSNPSYRPAQMAWRRDLLLARLRGPLPPTPPTVGVPLPPDTVRAWQGYVGQEDDGAEPQVTILDGSKLRPFPAFPVLFPGRIKLTVPREYFSDSTRKGGRRLEKEPVHGQHDPRPSDPPDIPLLGMRR